MAMTPYKCLSQKEEGHGTNAWFLVDIHQMFVTDDFGNPFCTGLSVLFKVQICIQWIWHPGDIEANILLDLWRLFTFDHIRWKSW